MKYSLLLYVSLMGCTLHIIDDTQDYGVSVEMETPECKVTISSNEKKETGSKTAKVTQ